MNDDYIDWDLPQTSVFMPDKWIVAYKIKDDDDYYMFLSPNGEVGVPKYQEDFYDYYFDDEDQALTHILSYNLKYCQKTTNDAGQPVVQSEGLFEE